MSSCIMVLTMIFMSLFVVCGFTLLSDWLKLVSYACILICICTYLQLGSKAEARSLEDND